MRGRVPYIVRPKLFTLGNRLLLRQLGVLAAEDMERARELLRTVLALTDDLLKD